QRRLRCARAAAIAVARGRGASPDQGERGAAALRTLNGGGPGGARALFRPRSRPRVRVLEEKHQTARALIRLGLRSREGSRLRIRAFEDPLERFGQLVVYEDNRRAVGQ